MKTRWIRGLLSDRGPLGRGLGKIWILRVLLLLIVMLALLGFLVMRLWNWLVPTIFGGRPIDLWQAVGLLVVTKILFGDLMRAPRGGREHWRRLFFASRP
jgi:hypothetical protein